MSHCCRPPNRWAERRTIEGSASWIAHRGSLRDCTQVQTLRGLIVDDSDSFLTSASRLLESQGIEIVGTAGSSAEALELAASTQPDLALVDVELGEEDGFALAGDLRSRFPETLVVLISTYEREEIQDLVAASAALGFLPKRGLSGDAIRALLNGDQRSAR
jgi:DNA-binding NarL/FixJ family response regulator